ISKPIIAAVNGAALGGGAEIALACDLIVAARSASFGLPEVRRGLVAGAGGAFRLVDQVPRRVAMQMLLTGEAIDADRALELDLINMVVPDDQVRSAAAELARTIASNAPLAVQAAKRIARGQDGDACPGESEHWARTAREVDVLMASSDAAEGPRAFAEKRPPVWSGR
ncbi:MAG: enoyl-CoA hydratase-related protein, partial [Rhodococcus sp. (in: high G+C Gram-positive bacteria)]|uniref:enoyl-CoA hydratase-related protein n=1 Tax=Rhodococcus sp. TaxID=1831 RepID=UPI003BB1759A